MPAWNQWKDIGHPQSGIDPDSLSVILLRARDNPLSIQEADKRLYADLVAKARITDPASVKELLPYPDLRDVLELFRTSPNALDIVRHRVEQGNPHASSWAVRFREAWSGWEWFITLFLALASVFLPAFGVVVCGILILYLLSWRITRERAVVAAILLLLFAGTINAVYMLLTGAASSQPPSKEAGHPSPTVVEIVARAAPYLARSKIHAIPVYQGQSTIFQPGEPFTISQPVDQYLGSANSGFFQRNPDGLGNVDAPSKSPITVVEYVGGNSASLSLTGISPPDSWVDDYLALVTSKAGNELCRIVFTSERNLVAEDLPALQYVNNSAQSNPLPIDANRPFSSKLEATGVRSGPVAYTSFDFGSFRVVATIRGEYAYWSVCGPHGPIPGYEIAPPERLRQRVGNAAEFQLETYIHFSRDHVMLSDPEVAKSVLFVAPLPTRAPLEDAKFPRVLTVRTRKACVSVSRVLLQSFQSQMPDLRALDLPSSP